MSLKTTFHVLGGSFVREAGFLQHCFLVFFSRSCEDHHGVGSGTEATTLIFFILKNVKLKLAWSCFVSARFFGLPIFVSQYKIIPYFPLSRAEKSKF